MQEEHTGRTQHCAAAKLELEASMTLYDRVESTKHNVSIQPQAEHNIEQNSTEFQHKDVRLHAKQSSCTDMENGAYIQ